MPFVETRFISPTTLTTSASSALYTVPTGYSAIIKQLVVTNITGTAATFTFYIGAASAGNALFSGTSVAANDTVIINLSQVLTTGEILRALASTGSALNLTVSGVLNDGPLASTATYIADNAITSAKIADGAIVNADINASAAIDKTKISGTAVTVADTGTITSTMILDGTILNADINASAAIDQSKINAPTAAAGTNTTQLATTAFANAAGGLVYITAGTASATNRLNIPSCFSSTYANYRVEVDNLTHTTANNLIMRLSISGTDTSGSAYYTQRAEVNASAVVGISLTASSAIFPTYANSSAGSFVTLSFDVFKPNVATPTTIAGQCSRVDATTGLYGVYFSGLQSDSTAFDGISLVGNTGNISCTMRVYGYRQA